VYAAAAGISVKYTFSYTFAARFAVGQNTFIIVTEVQEMQRPDWMRALRSWFLEKKKLPHDYVYRYVHNDTYAAYTQLVWDRSYLVGCGYSSSYFKDGVRHIFVCNYGPKYVHFGKN
jgi:hypothetical protein